MTSVKISAGVPKNYVTKIKTGQNVTVTSDAIPGAEFEGKINYVSPSLSSGSRTFEVEVVINNRGHVLKPEMNAAVVISQSSKNDAIVIPQEMIVDYGDEQYVFVVEGEVSANGEAIVKKRVIKLGGREENQVMVVSGLNNGDKLITEGYQSLVDGAKVQVAE